MELTIKLDMKNNGLLVIVGTEKLIKMLPCIIKINNIGIPTDLNVQRSTTNTINIDIIVTTMLSRSNDFLKSYSFVEFPTT